MSWQSVQLSTVCNVIMGQAPVGTSYNNNGEGLALIAGAGDFGNLTPSPKKHTTKPSKICKADDLILCIRATIGDLNWSDKEYCLGRGVAGLRPISNKLDKHYLWHFINANKSQLEAKGSGSTFKQVSKSDIEEWSIPLPPLPEQKRIAAILDKADSLRRKNQEAIQLADKFLQAVFFDMFGDPVTNPKEWPVHRVGSVLDCIVPGRDKPKSFTGNIPWITTNDLYPLGFTKDSKISFGLTENEILEVKAKVVPTGSVLMTCVGDLGVLSISGKDIVINQQLHAFLPSNEVSNVFLMFALSFQKAFMLKMASNTTVPYMNKTICNSIPLILPPTHLQNRFSCIYEKTQNLIKSKIGEIKSEELFSSLNQKAFAGEL